MLDKKDVEKRAQSRPSLAVMKTQHVLVEIYSFKFSVTQTMQKLGTINSECWWDKNRSSGLGGLEAL